jgi:hypothetical protein
MMRILDMEELNDFKAKDPSPSIIDLFVSRIRDLVCAIA